MTQIIYNVITEDQLEAFGRKIAKETWEEARKFFTGNKMMTFKEVMEFYRCSRTSLNTKIKRGELHPTKIGAKLLFKESEVKFNECELLKY